MSIRQRIKIGGATIAIVVLLAFVIAALGVNRIRLGGMLHHQNQQLSDFVSDILPPPEYVLEPYLEATLLVESPKAFVEHGERLAKLEADYHAEAQRWTASDLDPDLKQQLASQSAASAQAFWHEIDGRFLPAARAGDQAAMVASYARITAIYVVHRGQIDALVITAQKKQAAVVDASSSTLMLTTVVLGVLAMTIMTLIGAALRSLDRSVVTPIDRLAGQLEQMTRGEFDIAIAEPHGEDEIAQIQRAACAFREAGCAKAAADKQQYFVVSSLAKGLDALADGDLSHQLEIPFANSYESLRQTFNRTVERLADLMQRVSASSERVATGAGEIRAASDELASRNEQQAANVEETSAAMNRITGIVRDTADNAATVQHSIVTTHREASEGGDVVARATGAMAAIERSAQEISNIIGVIDGIAFQTNLLALNAGVEAARAGDAGKGFAVVANEVRALAQRSADAAKDIKTLISTSADQVESGVTLVAETGSLLERIVASVGEISGRVTDIAASTQQQAVTLQQVNTRVGEMDRVTQQNAAMVEQSTAAARGLADESLELTRMVGQFRTLAVMAPARAKPRLAA